MSEKICKDCANFDEVDKCRESHYKVGPLKFCLIPLKFIYYACSSWYRESQRAKRNNQQNYNI